MRARQLHIFSYVYLDYIDYGDAVSVMEKLLKLLYSSYWLSLLKHLDHGRACVLTLDHYHNLRLNHLC
jgi:hypothetical protein